MMPAERCGTMVQGEDPDPLLHQVIEIHQSRHWRPVIACIVWSDPAARLTPATLPAYLEASHYCPRLRALVGLLFHATAPQKPWVWKWVMSSINCLPTTYLKVFGPKI